MTYPDETVPILLKDGKVNPVNLLVTLVNEMGNAHNSIIIYHGILIAVVPTQEVAGRSTCRIITVGEDFHIVLFCHDKTSALHRDSVEHRQTSGLEPVSLGN